MAGSPEHGKGEEVNSDVGLPDEQLCFMTADRHRLFCGSLPACAIANSPAGRQSCPKHPQRNTFPKSLKCNFSLIFPLLCRVHCFFKRKFRKGY